MALHGARSAAAERARALTPGEIAWIAAVPAAVLALLAIVVLGPPLGRALLPAGRYEFWPSLEPAFRSEPVEQGRFLVSLAAPLLLAAFAIAGVRRAPRLRPVTAAVLVTGAQVLTAAFVVGCLLAQRGVEYGAIYGAAPGTADHRAYFTLTTFAVAALIAAAVVAAIRSEPARDRFAAWARDTSSRRVALTAVAALATAIWLLHAFNTEGSIGNARLDVSYHMMFTLDETMAVLNDRSPLVDFAAQYGSLWPYAIAAVLSLPGATVGWFSALTLLITGVAMVAIYIVLRRVARSPLAGLLLFLPFLASSFFVLNGTLDNRYTFGTLSGTFPMRYAGPFLLAWVLVRHLDGARPQQPWLVFLAAGLVVLNNADAGIPAFGAAVAALLWTARPPWRSALARLGIAVVAGAVAALALVSLLTLLRAGSLPHLELLLRYARMFGAAGFGLLPMPALGLHLVIYLTFVAAIGTATVRALASHADADRALTGMLAFSGVFGLGAGAYYVGRSHPESLIAMFTTWTFALALLTVVVIRTLAERPKRAPSIAALTCLFGFGVAACSLAQTPLPWQQLDRAATTTEPALANRAVVDFVAANALPGERVVVLNLLGHRIAEDADVVNVAPYTGMQSMPLTQQLDETVQALREEDGSRIFLTTGDTLPDMRAGLQARGFVLEREDRANALQMWVDRTP